MLVKVNKVNVGNGVVRFDVEPTCACERIPSSALESILRDVVAQDQKVNSNTSCTRAPEFVRPTSSSCLREPDGIDVHVDRPLRENFGSHRSWANAMSKYRTLERVAKDCDWECKEPIASVPNYRRVKDEPRQVLEMVIFETPDWLF